MDNRISKSEIAELLPNTAESVRDALRTYEQWGGALRYRERDKWHLSDIVAMRKVLDEFAVRLDRSTSPEPRPEGRTLTVAQGSDGRIVLTSTGGGMPVAIRMDQAEARQVVADLSICNLSGAPRSTAPTPEHPSAVEPDLATLSDEASPGDWVVAVSARYIFAPSTNPHIGGKDVVVSTAYSDRVGGEDSANLRFIARLVRDYRAGRLVAPRPPSELRDLAMAQLHRQAGEYSELQNYLDQAGVPHENDGVALSLIGRVNWYAQDKRNPLPVMGNLSHAERALQPGDMYRMVGDAQGVTRRLGGDGVQSGGEAQNGTV